MTQRPEKRQEKRDFFSVTVDYAYSTITDGKLDCKIGTAVTSNISAAGIGFYADTTFALGQDVKVYGKRLNDNPLSAVVKWCNQVSDNVYKVGMMVN